MFTDMNVLHRIDDVLNKQKRGLIEVLEGLLEKGVIKEYDVEIGSYRYGDYGEVKCKAFIIEIGLYDCEYPLPIHIFDKVRVALENNGFKVIGLKTNPITHQIQIMVI